MSNKKSNKQKVLMGILIPVATLATAAAITAPLCLTQCSGKTDETVTPKVNDIVVSQTPDKIHYLQHEKLNLDGLIIQKVMSDGKLERLYKNEYTTSIEDGQELTDLGNNTITVVSKKDKKSATFTVNVSSQASADFNLIKTDKGYCIDGLNNPERGDITEIVVPEEIDGTPVVEISKGAFKGCKNLQSITLPFIGHTATSTEVGGLFGYVFGDQMYEGCGSYTWQSYSTNDQYGVEPEESVGWAIPGTLKNVTITGGSYIAPGAFSGCSHLQNITFKESNSFDVTEIGNFAFYNCISLKSAPIPSKIKTIGRSAYAGCYNMKEIVLPETVETIKPTAFSNCLAAYKVLISSDITTMGKLAFENFAGLLLCENESRPGGWDDEWVTEDSTVVFNYQDGGVIYAEKYIAAICGPQENQFVSIIQLVGDDWYKEKVTLPNEISYKGTTYPVKNLGANLMYDNTTVKEVEIPENIETIGPNCFEGCTNLVTVKFPSTLKTIGSYCFKDCQSLKNSTAYDDDSDTISFNQVQEIGVSAFEGLNSIIHIDLGSNMTTIRDSAFKDCINLTPLRDVKTSEANPLIFPKTIKEIGSYAFYNICKIIQVDPETQAKKTKNIGDIEFEAGNINDEVTIGESAFELAGVRSTSVEYPSTIYFKMNFNNIPVKTFSKCSFKNCYMYWFYNFPQTVEEIGEQAFYDSIPVYTEENTSSSTSRLITIPKSVKSIGYRAFYDCYNCGFKFEVDENNLSELTTIGEQAFRYCSYNPANDTDDKSGGAYKVINMPDSVTTCGSYAFGSNTGARTVHISTGLTRLESGMFSSCKYLGYDQNDNHLVENDSDVTYDNPVVVPENITYIGSSVFSDCNVLKAVTIEGKITTLGSSAFANCAGLEHGKTMTNKGNKPLNSIIFTDGLESVTSFGSSIYQGCTNLIWAPWQMSGAGVTTPYSSIPSYSFTDCNKLTDFEILPAVTSIGNSAFRSCSSMEQVTGMTAVKYIYQNAFDGCTSLVKFEMPSGCHTIGDYAFKNCINLGKSESFVLPTDIVKKWTSSSNIGMGTEPFVGWKADQEITFTESNIDQEATANRNDGTVVLKWGWELTPNDPSTPTYYTCAASGSEVVHFVKAS